MRTTRAVYDAKATETVSAAQAARIARESGYESTDDDLLGVSCGNPVAIAQLQPGETVVDLGAGAGFDVFLAASKVGHGFAIGLDGSAAMIDRARTAATRRKHSPPHVAFAQAELGKALPLQDGSVDLFISNCVINLLEDAEKATLFCELFRCLKPGGRVAISDILARRDLPPEIQNNLAAKAACIGGAVTPDRQHALLQDAGFESALSCEPHLTL